MLHTYMHICQVYCDLILIDTRNSFSFFSSFEWVAKFDESVCSW